MSKNVISLGHIKAMTLTGASKPVVVAGAEAVGGSAAHGATPAVAGLAIGTGGSMAGLILFGGFGVVSALSNYVEYMQERADIANFYREEIGAKNKKAQNQITDADLSVVENGNPQQGIEANKVIKEAVGHERKKRNLGIAASFVASIAVFALMGALGVHVPIGATVAFGAQVALSVMAYMAVKSPLMKVGSQVFGINKKTTHEKILGLAEDREKGKAISREQVVEVFVSANKQLSEYVEQHFGRDYDELSLADKVKVSQELANMLPVDKIANSINLGMSNASELAFTVQGEVSGVLPKAPERAQAPTAFAAFAQRCKGMMHSVSHMFHAEKAHPIHTISKINDAEKRHEHSKPAESPVVEFNEPSFAENVGRNSGPEKSFAQQVTDRRAQQVHLSGSNTIQ